MMSHRQLSINQLIHLILLFTVAIPSQCCGQGIPIHTASFPLLLTHSPLTLDLTINGEALNFEHAAIRYTGFGTALCNALDINSNVIDALGPTAVAQPLDGSRFSYWTPSPSIPKLAFIRCASLRGILQLASINISIHAFPGVTSVLSQSQPAAPGFFAASTSLMLNASGGVFGYGLSRTLNWSPTTGSVQPVTVSDVTGVVSFPGFSARVYAITIVEEFQRTGIVISAARSISINFACAPGHYFNSSAIYWCSPCPLNSWNDEWNGTCIACVEGWRSAVGAPYCMTTTHRWRFDSNFVDIGSCNTTLLPSADMVVSFDHYSFGGGSAYSAQSLVGLQISDPGLLCFDYDCASNNAASSWAMSFWFRPTDWSQRIHPIFSACDISGVVILSISVVGGSTPSVVWYDSIRGSLSASLGITPSLDWVHVVISFDYYTTYNSSTQVIWLNQQPAQIRVIPQAQLPFANLEYFLAYRPGLSLTDGLRGYLDEFSILDWSVSAEDVYFLGRFGTAAPCPGMTVSVDGDGTFPCEACPDGTFSQPAAVACIAPLLHLSLDRGLTDDITGKNGTFFGPSQAHFIDSAEARFGNGSLCARSSGQGWTQLPSLSFLQSPITHVSSFTIALWVRPDAVSGTQPLFSDFFFSNMSLVISSDKTVKWSAVSAENVELWLASNSALKSSSWTHIALMWDQFASPGWANATLWLNGSLSASRVFPATALRSWASSGWIMGKSPASGFQGRIDEVWIINGTLPIGPLQLLLKNNTVFPCPPGSFGPSGGFPCTICPVSMFSAAGMTSCSPIRYGNSRESSRKEIPSYEQILSFRSYLVSVTIPDSFDWGINADLLSSVDHQGDCQGCGAFSLSASLETAFAHVHQLPVATKLSSQQLIDCSLEFEKSWLNYAEWGIMYIRANWCGSGVSSNQILESTRWVLSHGLCAASDYPYIGANMKCSTGCNTEAGVPPNSMQYCQGNGLFLTIEEIKAVLFLYGPIAAAIQVSDEFMAADEKTTFPSNLDCRSHSSRGLHRITIVGYGFDNKGVAVWHVKNSWGTGWKNKGFVRIRMASAKCFKLFGPSTWGWWKPAGSECFAIPVPPTLLSQRNASSSSSSVEVRGD